MEPQGITITKRKEREGRVTDLSKCSDINYVWIFESFINNIVANRTG